MRKRFTILFSLILVLFFWGFASAAGTAKVTSVTAGKVRFVIWTWTADASGDVTGTALGQFAVDTRGGTVFGILADPETGVTDLYDVTVAATFNVIAESAGRELDFTDVTGGYGSNLSSSTNGQNASLSAPFTLPACRLTITVDNAGNATSGTFILLIWEE